MNRFAALLDRLAHEASRNARLRLLTDYFSTTADPDRGYALAAFTGALSFKHAKPTLLRTLIAERTDPMLFALSYDYVGDLAETVALMWPAGGEVDLGASGHNRPPSPTLSDIVETLHHTKKADLPQQLAGWLDQLDEDGRWALLKLITGALRIGVSARLAKTAIAAIGHKAPDDVEHIWHGLKPPYLDLFAWLEGLADAPQSSNPAPFRPPMLSHALEVVEFETLAPTDFVAEWKWDGIRVQASAGRDEAGRYATRLYSRTGEDISAAFPDVLDAMQEAGFGETAVDGELLIVIDGRVQPFGVLQQRLNRKTVSAKLVVEFPAHVRVYDLLSENGEDLRALHFVERRARLEAFMTRIENPRFDLSRLVLFETWDELARARRDPASAGAGDDAQAVEGVMLKRRDSIYVPGRPKGPWFKWKRDPYAVDAVLMYAQRGHGKRSSFYSDFTFGVWRGSELVPVGKAYFGFTDVELVELDRFVRDNTVNRFGPVREVTHEIDKGLVLEIAFEGLNRSTRHKSGVAMRFPRIARIRRDKSPRDADQLEILEALIGAAR